MNLKDRLESIKKACSLSINDGSKNDFFYDIEKIFVDSKEVRAIVAENISAGKNIAFISEPTIDKSLILKYLKHILEDKKIEASVHDEISLEGLSSEFEVGMYASPRIEDVVKILEYIMYGYKSFVFGMNFANSDNIIKKIKTAILINHKNMNEESIDILLSSSNLVIVYFDKNADGLFYISKIDKIFYEGLIGETVSVVDFQVKKTKIKKLKPLKKIKKEVLTPLLEENEEEIVSLERGEEQHSEPLLQENTKEKVQVDDKEIVQEELQETVPEEVSADLNKKVNKYKLLKEKIKNKRVVVSE